MEELTHEECHIIIQSLEDEKIICHDELEGFFEDIPDDHPDVKRLKEFISLADSAQSKIYEHINKTFITKES